MHRANLVRAISTAALALSLLVGVGAATATTGTTPLAHPPRYRVTKAQVKPYLGHFVLGRGRQGRIISAAYIGGYNDRGFVEGGLAIYTYDTSGHEVSWVGRTYEYHHTRAGMTIDVISAANEQIFARLHLHVVRGGRLSGTLRELLPVPRKAIPITLRPKS